MRKIGVRVDVDGFGYPGRSGNPINFDCGDGSMWSRPSHGKYNFEGRVQVQDEQTR